MLDSLNWQCGSLTLISYRFLDCFAVVYLHPPLNVGVHVNWKLAKTSWRQSWKGCTQKHAPTTLKYAFHQVSKACCCLPYKRIRGEQHKEEKNMAVYNVMVSGPPFQRSCFIATARLRINMYQFRGVTLRLHAAPNEIRDHGGWDIHRNTSAEHDRL